MFTKGRLLLFCGLIGLSAFLTRARQPLETETARPPQKGAFEVQTAFEYQTSKEGTEHALPFAFEYGISDRLSIMAEPVFYTAIRPKTGTRATGIGDLEVTLSYLFAREKGSRPALAFAGEVLSNTGSSPEAGTVTTITSPIVTPEVSSGELVGMFGFRYRVRERLFYVRSQL